MRAMKPIAATLPAAIAAAFLLSVPAFAQNAPDAAKAKEAFATCVACHGEDGNSNPATTLWPTLAQQHPEYLLSQYMAFKNGTRTDETMQPFAAMLEEKDARKVFAWVAAQKAKTPEAKVDAKSAELGEKIFRGGIQDRRIPSCAACHSPDGGGIPVQYPRIAGQHSDYTAKQLTAFRDGTRTTNQTMADVAAKMNDREIKAVSDYIASLR